MTAHCVKIEPEAEFAQQRQFEAHHLRAGVRGVQQGAEHFFERRVDFGVRIALGQQPAERAEMGDAVDRMAGGEQARGGQRDPLDLVVPEMLVEPRPPGRADPVAGLQHRPHARAGAAAHQAEMAAMTGGHQFDDGRGLPVALDAEHDAFVDPFHACASPDSRP